MLYVSVMLLSPHLLVLLALSVPSQGSEGTAEAYVGAGPLSLASVVGISAEQESIRQEW